MQSGTIAHVDLFNGAIATSGDYFQVLIFHQLTLTSLQSAKFGYFHIINPKSRKALQASANSIARYDATHFFLMKQREHCCLIMRLG
jgi:thiamine biosynthesis lipoprotein ApbE